MGSNIIICALLAAINLEFDPWWFVCLRVRHAFIGGLCGSPLAASGGNWHVIIWSQPSKNIGGWAVSVVKVIVPMVTSPFADLCLDSSSWRCCMYFLQKCAPARVIGFLAGLKNSAQGAMGFMHARNYAQKTMGIIHLTLLAATTSGLPTHLPGASFLPRPTPPGKEMEITALESKLFAR